MDTTLGYARLYDGTVAADYYQAMALIERLDDLAGRPANSNPPGELIALVDSLRTGTLNDTQRETLRLYGRPPDTNRKLKVPGGLSRNRV